ncbi:MAG: hypothetical protein ACK559_00790, partial [bacterium]
HLARGPRRRRGRGRLRGAGAAADRGARPRPAGAPQPRREDELRRPRRRCALSAARAPQIRHGAVTGAGCGGLEPRCARPLRA